MVGHGVTALPKTVVEEVFKESVDKLAAEVTAGTTAMDSEVSDTAVELAAAGTAEVSAGTVVIAVGRNQAAVAGRIQATVAGLIHATVARILKAVLKLVLKEKLVGNLEASKH
jgi:hypothetical protein